MGRLSMNEFYRKELEKVKPKAKTLTEQLEQDKMTYAMLVDMSPKKIDKMVNDILDMYEEGRYTMDQCCRAYGCTLKVFNRWVRPEIVVEALIVQGKEVPPTCYPDLNTRYHEVKDIAAENYANNLKQVSRTALMKKVTGFVSVELSETRVLDSRLTITNSKGEEVANPNFGKMMVTAQRVKKKQEAPDTAAIIFALTNVDKKNFKNRNSITADVPEDIDLSNMTDEEVDDILNKLSEKHRKI